MKRTGELISLNGIATQGAANGYAQVAMATAISTASDDALLLLGGQLEFSSALEAGASREVALGRATKAVMPNILDDDVILKNGVKFSFSTSGLFMQDLTPFIQFPDQSIVIVESNIYLYLKSLGQSAAFSATVLLFLERVTLTAAEKNAILSARLNNLLN